MIINGKHTCPYLKGSPSGTLCDLQNMHLKDLHESNIRLCTSHHYEACYEYVSSLYELNPPEQAGLRKTKI